MTSKRENILAYVETTLASTAGVSSRVYRSRPEAVRREETPCLLIEPIQDAATYENLPFMTRNIQFRVSVLVRGVGPDTVADPIYVDMYKKLMADRSLGNRCMDLWPVGDSYNFVEGDQPILIMSCTFNAFYRHYASDPEN